MTFYTLSVILAFPVFIAAGIVAGIIADHLRCPFQGAWERMKPGPFSRHTAKHVAERGDED